MINFNVERTIVYTTSPMECYGHMIDGLVTFSKGEDGVVTNFNNVLETWGDGCLELFCTVGQYADFCARLLDAGLEMYDDCPGVYDYEVSFEFGGWFGTYILENVHAPSCSEAFDKLEELASKFFGQFEPKVCEACDGLGVILAVNRGFHQIQRCDACHAFESDSDAALHVFNKFVEANS